MHRKEAERKEKIKREEEMLERLSNMELELTRKSGMSSIMSSTYKMEMT